MITMSEKREEEGDINLSLEDIVYSLEKSLRGV